MAIAAVGRTRATPELALADLYCERARALGPALGFPKLDLLIIDVSKAASPAARMAEEAARLSRALPKGGFRIALDAEGKALTSEAFAHYLGRLRDRGVRDCAFLIGGPDGLDPEARALAEERLALGPQTWPHLLVRAMLAEQIYRAFSILAHHPYHRSRAR
jgi:23S rRNA (pseudouridine1915-N3)-methyltransferase